jgi:POT family proton-dependent oligopeptide transporter
MAGLELDHSIPAGLVEDDRRLSLNASLEKKDPVPMDDDDDSAHEGLEFPSEEELATLHRVSDALPWTAYSEWSPPFPISIPTFCGSDRCRRVG